MTLGVELVALGGCADELRELVGPHEQIGDVELPDRETAKEARCVALQDLAARAEQRGGRRELAAEPDEVALVAARAVQEQQRPAVLARLEDVGEAEIAHACVAPSASRPCGASRSTTGPAGTIPVGLMFGCVP
jgi:hypothetical protein